MQGSRFERYQCGRHGDLGDFFRQDGVVVTVVAIVRILLLTLGRFVRPRSVRTYIDAHERRFVRRFLEKSSRLAFDSMSRVSMNEKREYSPEA